MLEDKEQETALVAAMGVEVRVVLRRAVPEEEPRTFDDLHIPLAIALLLLEEGAEHTLTMPSPLKEGTLDIPAVPLVAVTIPACTTLEQEVVQPMREG